MAAYESRVQAPRPPAPQPASVRLRTDPPIVSDLPSPVVVGSIAAVMLAAGVLWWKPWHQRVAGPATGETLAANPSAASADSAAHSTATAASPPPTSPAPPPPPAPP